MVTDEQLRKGMGLLMSEGYFREGVTDANIFVWGLLFKDTEPKDFEGAILDRLKDPEKLFQALGANILGKAGKISYARRHKMRELHALAIDEDWRRGRRAQLEQNN